MKLVTLIVFTIALFASCSKDNTPQYPDCFADLSATHDAKISFGGGKVVSLSDTSALVFDLADEELNIGMACKTFSVDALNEGSYIQYVEWKLHPDSIPPDLTSDALYANTSSTRSWNITGGNITAAVSKPAQERDAQEWYSISFKLSSGHFDRSQNNLEDVVIDLLIIRDADAF